MGSVPSLRATGRNVWTRLRQGGAAAVSDRVGGVNANVNGNVESRRFGRIVSGRDSLERLRSLTSAGKKAGLAQALIHEAQRAVDAATHAERAARLAGVLDAVAALAEAHGIADAELAALREGGGSRVQAARGLRQQLKLRASGIVAHVWSGGGASDALRADAASEVARGARAVDAVRPTGASEAARGGSAYDAGRFDIARGGRAYDAGRPSGASEVARGGRTAEVGHPAAAASKAARGWPANGARRADSGASEAARGGRGSEARRPEGASEAARGGRESEARRPGGAGEAVRGRPANGARRAESGASEAVRGGPTSGARRPARGSPPAHGASEVARGARPYDAAALAPRMPVHMAAWLSPLRLALALGAAPVAVAAATQRPQERLVAASLRYMPRRLHRQLLVLQRSAVLARSTVQLVRAPELTLAPEQMVVAAASVLLSSGRSGLQLTYRLASAGAQLWLRRYVLPKVLRYVPGAAPREVVLARPLQHLR